LQVVLVTPAEALPSQGVFRFQNRKNKFSDDRKNKRVGQASNEPPVILLVAIAVNSDPLPSPAPGESEPLALGDLVG
jgi:hypothetical protein